MSSETSPARTKAVRWSTVLLCVSGALFVALVAPYLPHLGAVATLYGAPILYGVLKPHNLLMMLMVTLVGIACHLRANDVVAFVGVTALASGLDGAVGSYLFVGLSFISLLLTRRPRFSILLGSVIIGLILVAVELKMRYAGSALTIQDIHYFVAQLHDNAAVVGSQPTLVFEVVIGLVALIGCVVLAWRRERPTVGAATWQAGRTRIFAMVMIAASTVAFFNVDRAARLVTHKSDAWRFGGLIRDSYPLWSFISTLYLQPHAIFESVDTQAFADEARHLIETTAAGGRYPDIVLILQESQFNPADIRGCPASLCQLSAFKPEPFTRDLGDLRVHVKGSGTWLSEFTVLTGIPHNVWGPAGTYAPFNIAPAVKRSFVRSLKKLGYRTVAIYPVGGGMMNARAAYRAYGFDRFYDAVDLKLSGTFTTPDAMLHAALVRTLHDEQSKNQPVFVMALTIFNHSEHGVHMSRVPHDLIQEAESFVGVGQAANDLADYVWRSREFEQSLFKIEHELLATPRPTLLAWFGDHQPPFMSATGIVSRFASQDAARRAPVDFLSWYDIEANFGDRHPSPRTMDIAFLPGLIAEQAGIPFDDWIAGNVVARQRCGDLFDECSDPNARNAYLTYMLRDLKSIE